MRSNRCLAFRGDYTFSIVKEAASLLNRRASFPPCQGFRTIQDYSGLLKDLQGSTGIFILHFQSEGESEHDVALHRPGRVIELPDGELVFGPWNHWESLGKDVVVKRVNHCPQV